MKSKLLAFVSLLICSTILLCSCEGFFEKPEVKPRFKYEYDFAFKSEQGDHIGVVDSVVFINDKNLDQHQSKAIIELLAFTVDNNKIYVTASNDRITGVKPIDIVERNKLKVVRGIYTPIPGTDSTKVQLVAVPFDSVKYYNSIYYPDYGGFILTTPRKTKFY